MTRTNEDIQYPRLLGSNEEKGGHTVQLEQEQELQLPEQQLQEQGDMLMVVCWDGLNHERRRKYCLYRLRFVAWMEEEMWTGGGGGGIFILRISLGLHLFSSLVTCYCTTGYPINILLYIPLSSIQ